MWIFGFSHGVCPTKLRDLVFSLKCLVSNVRRALLRGIRLDGSVTVSALNIRLTMMLIGERNFYFHAKSTEQAEHGGNWNIDGISNPRKYQADFVEPKACF